MKPTTDEVLAWAREVGLTGLVEGGLFGHFEQLYTLAYAAGAAAMKERAAKAVEHPYGRDCAAAQIIRALGDGDE